MGGVRRTVLYVAKNSHSLVEYTNHIGVDHKDISPEQILKMNKEDKWTFSNK